MFCTYIQMFSGFQLFDLLTTSLDPLMSFFSLFIVVVIFDDSKSDDFDP